MALEAQDSLRIAFKFKGRDSDRHTFNLVRQHDMKVKTACIHVARANGLPEVTREQFLFEMKWLGYMEESEDSYV